MAFTIGQESDDDEVVSAINTTPLVDVMLVLLIIFLITIPVAIHTVPLSLPKESNHVRETKPENINLSVTRDSEVYWNEQKLRGKDDLLDRLKKVAAREPQPEVQIHGDGDAQYEAVGRVVYTVQRAGILKIGFITEPPARQ